MPFYHANDFYRCLLISELTCIVLRIYSRLTILIVVLCTRLFYAIVFLYRARLQLRFANLYYLRQGDYVFVVVCLSVCLSVSNCAKTSERICMKFSGKVDNGTTNKCLNSGGDPDHRLDTGIVFWIRYYWETRKVLNGHTDKSVIHS